MLLRPAQPDDALAVASVHVRSWQVAYRRLLPDDYLDQLRAEDRAPHYDFATLDPQKPRTIVAEDDGCIRGFVTAAPSRDSDLPSYGEIYALYVDPEQWGQGIGAALMAAARAHLVQAGFQHALLWVLAGNLRAERFYRRDGWTSDDHRRNDTIWGITVEEVRYLRSL
ncbi:MULTISPECIES: GNAT family N-acetyltransferase [Acidobacteriaceae]|uniref:GNAT family N-acetyltransferase n=1 Tax=Acidobacteriaceae TaxID=204434 RepID=UPI00131E7D5C|nr:MULTISPECIES: GNAT family N-acetyltransferase [Acidobacteriaceae]MDW5265612.1 GNAT family N-acetyltransferase [Edaphobacter sp.]